MGHFGSVGPAADGFRVFVGFFPDAVASRRPGQSGLLEVGRGMPWRQSRFETRLSVYRGPTCGPRGRWLQNFFSRCSGLASAGAVTIRRGLLKVGWGMPLGQSLSFLTRLFPGHAVAPILNAARSGTIESLSNSKTSC
ncbi:unnamed protein product [Calypogeia fissa]